MKQFLIRLKVYVQRSLVYYQLVNSFMIFALWLKSENVLITIIFFLCLILGIVIIGYLDVKKLGLLEYEQTIYNSKNKELTEILNELKNLNEIIRKNLIS